MTQNRWRLEISVGILIAITLLAIFAQKKILGTTRVITPGTALPTMLFNDTDNDGNSTSEITDIKNYSWRCTLRDKYDYPYCDLNIFFDLKRKDGIDLSHYHTVRLWLDYKGAGETIRFYLRNYDPRYSKPDDFTSTKYNQVELSTDLLKNSMVQINMDDFFVADWWRARYKIPPILGRPQFDNTVVISIQTGSKTVLGDHEFRLNRIEFVGQRISTETWYLAIIMFWITLFIGFVAYRILSLKTQVQSQQKREKELVEINTLLDMRMKELEVDNKTDQLTGAVNRKGIEEAILVSLDEWHKNKKPLSLILMDIDHFKRINDKHGHIVGDSVLSTLTQIVTSHIRHKDVFARWGGEEFVLLSSDTPIDEATLVAEKIREIISTYEFDHGLHVTASFGVSTLKLNQTIDQLFITADKALYQAKHNGRNKVVAIA
jgi:diguanylate cyclase (GGDEF)-like protein